MNARESSSGPARAAALPRDVKAVAWGVLALGALAVAAFVHNLVQGQFMLLDLSLLYPLVGGGLLYRKELARKSAVGLAFVHIVMAALVLFLLVFRGFAGLPDLTAFGQPLDPQTTTGKTFFWALLVVMTAGAGAVIEILTRDEAKRLFAA